MKRYKYSKSEQRYLSRVDRKLRLLYKAIMSTNLPVKSKYTDHTLRGGYYKTMQGDRLWSDETPVREWK